jgi:hypothetical protein
MKPTFSILLALFVLLSASCDEEKTPQSARNTNTPRARPSQPIDTQAYYDSLLSVMLSWEDKIFSRPADTSLVRSFLKASFDTLSGAFFVAGKGTGNPEFPKEAQDVERQRVARYVGQRWALYLKAWGMGNRITFGKQISGQIMYCKDLRSKATPDTFYILLQIPVGSIVLKDE